MGRGGHPLSPVHRPGGSAAPGTEGFALGDDVTLSGPQLLFALTAVFMVGGKQQNRHQKQPDGGKMAEK